MFEFFTAPFPQNLINIALFVLGLVVVWVVLRFVLRIAFRLFAYGCLAILAAGVLIWVINYIT